MHQEEFAFSFPELREAFEAEAQEVKKPRLLLTAAVPVGPDNVRGGYDVPAVARSVSAVVVLGYDVPAVPRSVSAVVALGYDVPAVPRSVNAILGLLWP